MITVARYFEPSEAHVVRALLESAGLFATVADEHHVTANYPISTALGGVRVQVPADQVEAAAGLVAAYASGELQRELEVDSGTDPESCPECGTVEPTSHVPVGAKILSVALFALGSASFPTRASDRRCSSCGCRWATES
jgi:Putative prokaryotic signal transducing protein